MTSNANTSLELLIKNFLMDDEQNASKVTDSLEEISNKKCFEELGQALYRAMLNAHTARLHGLRATLSAQGPKRSVH